MLCIIWPFIKDGNLKNCQKIADLGKNKKKGYFEMAHRSNQSVFGIYNINQQLKKKNG